MEAGLRPNIIVDRHCERSEARHCERSEAIQRPFLASHKATGLLRRYAPRNDGFTAFAMTNIRLSTTQIEVHYLNGSGSPFPSRRITG